VSTVRATLPFLSVERETPSFRVFGREALAFARQAALLCRDLSATHAEHAKHGDDVVVLLHGLFATAGVLRPLRRSIERESGAHTAWFSYAPGPGVETLARRLSSLIDRLPAGVRIHLVGHSVGGLVARLFVQELGGHDRVVQTISVAAPFRGTRHARLMPGPAGRDISPGSALLERLERTAHRASSVPHLSIASACDSVVTESALFAYGDRMIVEHCGHNGLLYDPAVLSIIGRRIRGVRVC